MTPRLVVRHLNAWYGRARILFDVSLTVAPGEVVALLGRNGAGKTTTLASLMGLVPETTGDVIVDGASVSGLPPHRIARHGLGYVPEDRRVFTDLTVAENLAVGRQPSRAGVPRWTPEALYALFPNLADRRRHRAGEMSGGEQQMLTLARTLMGNPSVVLLDEPSEGLAPRVVAALADALRTMKAQGLTLVIAEQNPHMARALVDRVSVIEKGRIRFSGTMAELDAAPEIREAALAV